MVCLHLKTKQVWIAFLASAALLFPWDCSKIPKVAEASGIDINGSDTKAFQTRTGKTIIISETRSIGRSLSTIHQQHGF